MTPFGRPGQPVELASIYVQLAASGRELRYRTGLRIGRRKRPAVNSSARPLGFNNR